MAKSKKKQGSVSVEFESQGATVAAIKKAFRSPKGTNLVRIVHIRVDENAAEHTISSTSLLDTSFTQPQVNVIK